MPMNTYPASTDYFKAVQFPAQAFTLDSLQRAEFASDGLGLPTLAMGTSAVVFHAAVDKAPSALRCFIRSDASSRERYAALGEFLRTHDLKPYVTATTWIDAAIKVNEASWPVLQMEWIEGRTLDQYVGFLATGSEAAGLAMLADRWREMIAVLQRAEFAHGDLQHDNVLVDQDGHLRLVDFDGVWIPALAGEPAPTESGHHNYRHPQHSAAIAWGRWLDTFSALVIYLSLVALSKDQGLWHFYNSDNLLFQKADFVSPRGTRIWEHLEALGDGEVARLAGRLADCCDPRWVASKSLEMTIEPSWWEIQGSTLAPRGMPSAKPLVPAVGDRALSEPPSLPKPPDQSFEACSEPWPSTPAWHQPPGISVSSPGTSPAQPSGQPAGQAPWWEQAAQPGRPVPAQPRSPVPSAGPAKVSSVIVAVILVILGISLIAVTHGVSLLLIAAGAAYGVWARQRANRAAAGKSLKPPQR
jgi:eukaryotic-like serine/threonine-protein kinase